MKHIFTTLKIPYTLALLLMVLSLEGWGQSYTDVTATGAWNTSRWNNSADGPTYTSTYTANNNVIFTSGNYSFAGMGATINVGNITVNSGANVNFASAANTFATNGNVRTITVASGSTIDFAGQAFSTTSGTGFIKNGDGVLALAGGAYNGGFTLNVGTVIARGVDAFGANASNVLTLNGGTVASNATRAFTTAKFGGGIVIGGNVQFGELATVVSLANSSANLSFANNVSLGSSTRTLTLGNNGIQTLSGIVSNTSGGINFAANSGTTDGRFDITNTANTFTGDININGGEVRFTVDGSMGNAANDIIIDGGRFSKASDATTVTLNASRDIQVGDGAGTSIATPGTATSILVYNNAITDKTGETGSWAKQGGGILDLGGASTHTGNTSINHGTLRLTTGNNRLPVTTVLYLGQTSTANLGTLDLNGRNQTIAGLNSTSGTNASASNNTITSATAATLTITGAGSFGDGTNANSGVITGSVSLVKSGSGTLVLGDENTYTGTTTVSGGTLQLSRTGGATIPATNNVTINGGTLRISSNQTLNDLAIEAGGDLVVDGGVTLTINGVMSINESVTIAGNLTIGASGVATVAAGKALTISGTLTNSAGDAGLVVASGGSLIHSTASVPGTVQRSITAADWGVADDGWHLISSPVASQNIDGSWTPAGAGNGYDFYAWSEATNTWLNQKVGANNITAFEVGRGYIAAYEQTSTKAFTGNLNVANQTFTDLSYTPAQGNGWHLLGNPFASAIKWNDGNWALTAVAGTAKIWNESTRSYTDLLANAHIPVNNGFMVQVSNGTNSITIPILAREHNATAFYKSTDAFEGIKLIAAPSDLSSAQELVIRTDGQATNGFDFYSDSRFLPGGAPQFYSVVENEQLSTNSLLNISPEMTINLGFMKKNHEVNTITLVENTLADNLYLTDLKLNFTQKISENPVYSFTSAQGDDPNRFLLHFGAVGVDEAIPAIAVTAYVSNNILYVLNAQGKVQVDVLDLSGRMVYSQSMLASGLSSTPLNLPAGVYVVRISDGQTSKTNKVIVQ